MSWGQVSRYWEQGRSPGEEGELAGVEVDVEKH